MSRVTWDGAPLTPGVNVDAVDIEAGLKRLSELGYRHGNAQMEVSYNLRRWARGEESEADLSMGRSLSGVGYTAWRMVLAAALAGAGHKRGEV